VDHARCDALQRSTRHRRENTFNSYSIWEWTAEQGALYLFSTCSRPLRHIGAAVSQIAPRVGLYALVGTPAGAVVSGMLLWVLMLL
jgi:hypothetical protein